MSDFDEEALSLLVSRIEDEKFAKMLSALLGITTLSEKEILDRFDSIWEHGFESAKSIGVEIKTR